MVKLPLPLAIISLITGIVTWFLYVVSVGFENAGQISISTMMIIIGAVSIWRRK
jgi:hypothetical protein